LGKIGMRSLFHKRCEWKSCSSLSSFHWFWCWATKKSAFLYKQ